MTNNPQPTQHAEEGEGVSHAHRGVVPKEAYRKRFRSVVNEAVQAAVERELKEAQIEFKRLNNDNIWPYLHNRLKSLNEGKSKQ